MLQATLTRCIVQRLEAENTTTAGIILQRPTEQVHAKIVSVGNKTEGIAVGDRVLIDWSRVSEFDHDNQKYFLIDQNSILAVIN